MEARLLTGSFCIEILVSQVSDVLAFDLLYTFVEVCKFEKTCLRSEILHSSVDPFLLKDARLPMLGLPLSDLCLCCLDYGSDCAAHKRTSRQD